MSTLGRSVKIETSSIFSDIKGPEQITEEHQKRIDQHITSIKKGLNEASEVGFEG